MAGTTVCNSFIVVASVWLDFQRCFGMSQPLSRVRLHGYYLSVKIKENSGIQFVDQNFRRGRNFMAENFSRDGNAI